MLDTAGLQLDSQNEDSIASDLGIAHDEDAMDYGDDAGGDVEDFFVGDDAVQDDYGGDDFGGGEGGMFAPAQSNETGGRLIGAYEPFDPRRLPNERDFIMAMTNAEGEGSMINYFDQNFLKNWAGPEHWKLRRPLRKGEVNIAKYYHIVQCDRLYF